MKNELIQRLMPQTAPPKGYLVAGRLQHIGPTLLKAHLPGVFMGELCRLQPDGALAEVVGINGTEALLSPYGTTTGLHCGQRVVPLAQRHRVPVGDALIGRVIDGFGKPLDGGAELGAPWRHFDAKPPAALTRQMINQPLLTGIRAIDSAITCGEGQRMGIFSAPGVGKSTLLSMLCHAPNADINVLVLIGERGREVREFLELTLDEKARKRSVIVVSTSDRPALERMRALFVATTIAEAYRDRGKKVLLLADSLTRYARAAREIGLAAGETAMAGGYPTSVFATLPRLLERTGMAEHGSITAFYTVLVEADDMNEPLADEVRSLLDGHMVLSRRLAEAGHFPAIDVLASLSRIMPAIVSSEHRSLANALRQRLSTYRDVELLVRIGEYQRGQDAMADQAVDSYRKICTFLQQQKDEPCSADALLEKLRSLMTN